MIDYGRHRLLLPRFFKICSRRQSKDGDRSSSYICKVDLPSNCVGIKGAWQQLSDWHDQESALEIQAKTRMYYDVEEYFLRSNTVVRHSSGRAVSQLGPVGHRRGIASLFLCVASHRKT